MIQTVNWVLGLDARFPAGASGTLIGRPFESPAARTRGTQCPRPRNSGAKGNFSATGELQPVGVHSACSDGGGMAGRCRPRPLAAHDMALPRGADTRNHRGICRTNSPVISSESKTEHSLLRACDHHLQSKIRAHPPLTAAATADSVYSGALDRIRRSMLVLAFLVPLVCVVCARLANWALGLACGCSSPT